MRIKLNNMVTVMRSLLLISSCSKKKYILRFMGKNPPIYLNPDDKLNPSLKEISPIFMNSMLTFPYNN